MKYFLFIITFIFFTFNVYSQAINTKAIELTNNLNANYISITGTKLKIVPPKGFSKSTAYTGFAHELAGSSIVVSEIPGDVNRNFIGFDKKYLFKTGVIVEDETFYQINSYDALLIKAKQSAYGKAYHRLLLVIGDHTRTYLLSASILTSSSEKHINEVKDALLSVIYSPDAESDILDRFDFTVDFSGSGLQKGSMMLSSMTYTDDGNVPSKTKEKTSVTVRKSSFTKVVTEDEKKKLCTSLFEMYPLEWASDMSREPKPFKSHHYQGYEIYAMGKNKELYKNELIYQVILFDNLNYYVFTGITYGKFEDNLGLFKKLAKTIKSK